MKDSDNIPTIQEDIAIAEEWAKPENFPQHIVPGEGIGWRHVCYRLAQFAKKALNPNRVVTCIYCGKECLDGPHTRGCKKHPLTDTQEIIQAIESSIENTQELLAIHDRNLGRTTDRNKRRAQAFEYEIEHAQQVIRELKEQAVPTAVMEAKEIVELVGSASNNNHNHAKAAARWMEKYFPNT